MKELISQISEDSKLLGMLHNPDFRPDQALQAKPINKGRVLFEQNQRGLVEAEIVRWPVCQMTIGDTAEIKKMGPEEASETINFLMSTTPTAAMLLDAARGLDREDGPILGIWFSEEWLLAQNLAKIVGCNPEELFSPFEKQAERTIEILNRLIRFTDGENSQVLRLPFSNPRVDEAITEAVINLAETLNFNAKDKNKLKSSTALKIAGSHACFPPIMENLGIHDSRKNNKKPAVQGPLHLETNPPHWQNNPALHKVVAFIEAAVKAQFNPHRSLIPCLFNAEPIGEFSTLDANGPQLRQDQKIKLEAWEEKNPFPLRQNPLFGHAIGMLEDIDIEKAVQKMIGAEDVQDEMTAKECQRIITAKLNELLNKIGFWV